MNIEKQELDQRLNLMRQKMFAESFDALIIFSDEYRSGNSTYFTNYKPINVIEESPQLIILVKNEDPVVFIGRLNAYAAQDKIPIADVRSISEIESHIESIFSPLNNTKFKIGIIGDNLLPIKSFNSIKNLLGDAEFIECGKLLSDIRSIKSNSEIQLLSKAASINDHVLSQIVNKCEIGMTEIQIAAEAEYIGRKMGADLGSATVIMSGPNTNYPAWRPSNRVIEEGDFVMIDFNPSYENYCNDSGFTILMPGASELKKKSVISCHRIIKEIIPMIKPHTSSLSIYESILERLEPLGFADNFTPYVSGRRGVGHGVGLDVVEEPDLSSTNDFEIKPNMTLAVKLDLHNIEGQGSRIEVVTHITDSGNNPLNKFILEAPDDISIL
jgi:Xaa-Pro aminopeptidase